MQHDSHMVVGPRRVEYAHVRHGVQLRAPPSCSAAERRVPYLSCRGTALPLAMQLVSPPSYNHSGSGHHHVPPPLSAASAGAPPPVTAAAPAPTAADTFAMTSDSAWLFSAKEIANSPSRADGVEAISEARTVARIADILREASRLLRLPMLTTAVAIKYWQRFYMIESLKKHAPYDVAGACLFLACKVQETHKRLREVIYAIIKVKTKGSAVRCFFHLLLSPVGLLNHRADVISVLVTRS